MKIAENSKPLIIFGSSRGDGNTGKAIKEVFSHDVPEIIDLADLNFSDFDYEHHNQNDDFMPLAHKMTRANPIILATPIYWYMPSAIMKKFIDRFSDLLTIEKELGRKLKGKNLYLITAYHVHPEGKDGFEQIFRQICKYMGMNYQGCYFYYSGEDENIRNSNSARAQDFMKNIL